MVSLTAIESIIKRGFQVSVALTVPYEGAVALASDDTDGLIAIGDALRARGLVTVWGPTQATGDTLFIISRAEDAQRMDAEAHQCRLEAQAEQANERALYGPW